MKVLSYSVEGKFFRYVVIQKKNKDFVIEVAESMHLDALEQQSSRIGKMIRQEKNLTTATSIYSDKLYCNHLSFPLKSHRKIRSVLSFQLDKLPFNRENGVFNIRLSPFKNGATDVFVSAIHKDFLKDVIQTLSKVQLEPEWVGSDFQSLKRFLKWKGYSDCHLILHVSHDQSVLYYYKNDSSVKRFYIPIGASQMSQLIVKEQIKEFNQKNMLQFLQYFDRYIDSIQSENKNKQALSLFRTGYALQVGALTDRPNIALFDQSRDVRDAFYAREIGQALDVLAKDKMTIQFREGEYTPVVHTRRIRKQLLRILSLATCSILIGFLSLHVLTQKKLDSMSKEFNHILLLTQRKNPAFENYSYISLKNAIEDLTDQFEQTKPFMNVFGNQPKILNVLRIISEHSNEFNPQSMLSLNFDLISFPTLKNPSLPYESKIEICLNEKKDAEILIQVLKYKCQNIKNISIEEHDEAIKVQFYTA
ncbi:MAG: hypothetical protein K9M07_02725 [Simkaniaceae bacterium]|nr:hypothetical protein [Simkaniaceae bacterium]